MSDWTHLGRWIALLFIMAASIWSARALVVIQRDLHAIAVKMEAVQP